MWPHEPDAVRGFGALLAQCTCVCWPYVPWFVRVSLSRDVTGRECLRRWKSLGTAVNAH